MPEWLTWILSILLFIISLGVLIAIHELGHFLAAKTFNVYVQEYAIGMGPKLFSRKRKKGETFFSLRAVPFGGFCSMYGEDVSFEDGIRIPKERSLEGVSHIKRFVIFGAGIAMNFILAYVLFFINCAAFPQTQYWSDVLDVMPNSLAYDAGIRNHDILSFESVEQLPGYNIIDSDATLFIPTGNNGSYQEKEIVLAFRGLSNTNELNFSQDLFLLLNVDKSDPNHWVLDSSKPTYPLFGDEIEGYKLSFTPVVYEGLSETEFDPNNALKLDESSNPIKRNVSEIEVKTVISSTTYVFEDIGLNAFKYVFQYSFIESFAAAGEDWADANTLLFRAVGGLIIGQGWDQLGGPVAILTQTTTILQDMGFGYYIWYWGVISCNLAIFNLLPFPGLDGWHLVVTIFEGVTRKKIPNKVKNVVSAVGMILLFGLMIVVLIKDFIGLF